MCIRVVIIAAILLLTTNSVALAAITPEVLNSSEVQSTGNQTSAQTGTSSTTQQPTYTIDVAPVSNTQTTQTTQTIVQPETVDISTGLPTVTPNMFVSKINRITNSIYGMARGVIPGISVVALVAAVILGIVFQEARKIIAWSLIGLIIVLWAPQIIGFIVGATAF